MTTTAQYIELAEGRLADALTAPAGDPGSVLYASMAQTYALLAVATAQTFDGEEADRCPHGCRDIRGCFNCMNSILARPA